MISVIAYGRNDTHGYNLHRRAALSLNCIAASLMAETDEIIFVDYNTPDYLPTFPEAIGDTLTPRTKQLLRIIRVRPDIHDEYAGLTTLPVVEPLARNIALRRTRPGNHWALSTNTDMVFLTPGSIGLNGYLEGLPDLLHHSPRYELPEILWESLDRSDPAHAFGKIGAWAVRLRLDEIVRSNPDAVFDGPGDFQLFPIPKAAAIGGFEEKMIHGWHVDANFSRRMRIGLGRVAEMPRDVRAYHCGHTREPTQYHRSDSIQNDEFAFVTSVHTARSSGGLSDWGRPSHAFEEIRLGNAKADRVDVLVGDERTHAHSPLPDVYLTPETSGAIDYDATHVLAHVLNAIAHESANRKIGYIGSRRDLFDQVAQGWAHQPGDRVPLLTREDTGLADASTASTPLPLEVLLDTAQTLVFEFDRPGDSDASANASELGQVIEAFDAAIQVERSRIEQGHTPRRFIIINGSHSPIEPRVRAGLLLSMAPFSTRVRIGHVRPAPPDHEGQESAPRDDLPETILRSLKPDSPADDALWARACPDTSLLLAFLYRADATERLARPLGEIVALVNRLQAARPSTRWRSRLDDKWLAETKPWTASRAIRAEDWDRPEWREAASRLMPHVSLALADRSDSLWETISIAEAVCSGGSDLSGKSILYIAPSPDDAAAALANMTELSFLNSGAFTGGQTETGLIRRAFAQHGAFKPENVSILDAIASDAPGKTDITVIPAQTLRHVGRAKFAKVLRVACEHTRPGGRVIVGALARYASVTGLSSLSSPLLAGLAETFNRTTPLAPAGDMDFRLTVATLDQIADDAGRPVQNAPLLTVRHGAIMARTLWVLERSSDTEQDDWKQLTMRLAAGF